MNKTELKNYRSYHPPGCSHMRTRAKGAVHVSKANSIKHELAKAIGGLMIQRWGDVKFTPLTKLLLGDLTKQIEKDFKDWPKNPNVFITEACPNSEPKKRVDLVNITTDDRFEFYNTNLPDWCKDDDKCVVIKI